MIKAISPLRRNSAIAAASLALALLLICQAAPARTAVPPAPAPKLYNWEPLQMNNFMVAITNHGRLCQVQGGSDAYSFWPAPAVDASGNLVPPLMNYVYGWGLWVGSRVRSNKPGKTYDTLVTIGYNPNNGNYEFTPGAVINGVPVDRYSPSAKIYLSSRDDWPLTNSMGQDSVISKLDSWCQYNDYRAIQHEAGGSPLKIEVTQTTYEWNYPSNTDIVFFLFEVKNTGTDTLFDVYLAPTADCDIGNESGTNANDVCWYDSVNNMAFQWQTNRTESGWNRDVGCVGFMFLESPVGTKNFTFPDGHQVLAGQPIGLSAFKVFNINIDPKNDIDQYKELSGYNYQTGEFVRLDPQPPAGDQRFMESTGPFDLYPGATAKTIVALMCANVNYAALSSGNTLLAIDDLRKKAQTAKQIYDAGWLLPSPPPAPTLSVTPGHQRVIISWTKASESYTDPYFTAVTSDSSDLSKWDPNYKSNCFEGYKLYKSRNGTEWELAGQWDLDNRIRVDTNGVYITGPETLRTFVGSNPVYVPAATEQLFNNQLALQTGRSDLMTRATNSGLQYSYVDTGLINGFTYYYSVATYGVNWQSIKNVAGDSIIGKEPLYFETAISEKDTFAVPRSEPNDYVAPSAWISSYGGRSYPYGTRCQINIDLPRGVKAKTIRQVWGNSYKGKDILTTNTWTPVVTYACLDENGDTLVPMTRVICDWDTLVSGGASPRYQKEIRYSPGNFITIRNFIVNIDPNSFTIDSLTPRYLTTDTTSTEFINSPNMRWAFRSTRFEIRWHVRGTAPSDTLWAEVWDTANNVVIPMDTTQLNTLASSSWMFGGTGTAAGRSIVTSSTPTVTRMYMNICGIRIYFNRGSTVTRQMTWANHPAEGAVWVLTTSGLNVPSAGEYQVIQTQPYSITSSAADLGKVRVVPNPYLVRNIWERTNERPKLQFVNLPAKCKIKIYTMAGNLVQTLDHDDNSGIDGGTCWWDPMLTFNQQYLASGIYIYYVDAPGIGTKVGKFAVIR